VVVPGVRGLLLVSRFPDCIRVSRISEKGVAVDATGPTGAAISRGDGTVTVARPDTGGVRTFAADGVPAPPMLPKMPGVIMAASNAADSGAAVVVESSEPGCFKVRLVGAQGRARWDHQASGTPLYLRGWGGGIYTITALQAKDYPSTSIHIVTDAGCRETESVPGLVRCLSVSKEAGIVAAGSSTCVYAYDLQGRLRWCAEPGGRPVDVSAAEDGVMVAVRKIPGNGLRSLFMRDSVAMYDLRGTRLWRIDVGRGVTRVRRYERGVVVGTSSSVVALSASGEVLWELRTDSPVAGLEVSRDGDVLHVSTEAGEVSSYAFR
jgi:outer membrane protein assembly factor BamB